MTTPDRGRRWRRPPAVHRRPAVPAPETPEEVLERAPDVSRETAERDAEAAAWATLRDRAVPDLDLEPLPAEAVPMLNRDRIILLESLTARWARDVRIEGPADATLLYAAPPPPPPPRLEVVREPERVLEEPTPPPATVELELVRPAEPAGPVPARPARVSDWQSRHDRRSLEYPVRQLLERPVPLADVSLAAGPVLDQGTTPPLSLRDASACGGMAGATAANVLSRRGPHAAVRDLVEEDARRLYALAQDRDHVHGSDYAGTSVLGIMRAGQELELWESYLWALGGTRDVAQVLLQLRLAVVLGLPWSTQLEEPDAAGIIRPGGSDNGGHMLAAVGLRLAVGGRPGPWFELQQSRGPAEGSGGRVFMHHRDLAQLLRGVGEAAVPLPAGVLEVRP